MRPVPLMVGLLVLAAARLPAQRDARIEVTLPAVASGDVLVPSVRARNVLEDRSLRDLLHSGFPARLHYRLELWSANGLFDNLERQTEWDLVVRYNPLERRYAATRIEGDGAQSLGSFDALAGVEEALAQPFRPTFSPPSGHGRHYYIVTLDVEMLSVNDLDEVERWLRGELSPAVRGQRSPGTALGRGAQTLITRLLGGERRHYEARTGVFRI